MESRGQTVVAGNIDRMIMCESEDGYYLAWTQVVSGMATNVYCMRLNQDGETVWPEAVTIAATTALENIFPFANNPQPHNKITILISHESGVIVPYINRATGNVYVSKVSPSGMLLWGAAGKLLNTTGISVESDICLVDDKIGGAYAMYSGATTCRVQHFDASGNELWTSGGVQVSAAPPTSRPRILSDGLGTGIIMAVYGVDAKVYIRRFTDTTPTPTFTATMIPTYTPTPTSTYTVTPTMTATFTATATPVMSATNTDIPTAIVYAGDIIVDDCENTGTVLNLLGGYWFSFADTAGTGTLISGAGKTVPGSAASSFGKYIFNGTLGTGAAAYVGIGTDLAPDGGSADISLHGGIRFYASGDGKTYTLALTTENITDDAFYETQFTAPAGWALYDLTFSSFTQPSWRTTAKPFDRTNAKSMQLKYSAAGTSFAIELDHISIYLQPTPTVTPTEYIPASGEISLNRNAINTAKQETVNVTGRVFLPQGQAVKMYVYDSAGSLVKKSEYLNSAEYIYWDGTNNASNKVAAGVYVIVVKCGSYSRMLKIAVVK
jgi:hypothetical protein